MRVLQAESRAGASGRSMGRALSAALFSVLLLGGPAGGFGAAAQAIPGSLIAKPAPLTAGQGIGFQARRQRAASSEPVLTPVAAIDVSRFAFTAPGKGPTRSTGQERAFQFTPSAGGAGTGAGDRKPVALAMATRTSAPAAPVAAQGRAAQAGDSIGPESYGFDLSVAWKGLALSGAVERSVGIADSASEAVGLGVSYGGRGWRTGLRASAERGGGPLPLPKAALTERVALEATGAVAVAPSVSLGGSVRYQLAPINPTLLDTKKDASAVFVGGKVDF